MTLTGAEIPGCAAFGECGGCTLLNVPYLEQLALKDQHIADLFEGLCSSEVVRPIIGMDDPCHYRNKVIAPFAPARRGKSGSTSSRKRKGESAKPAIGGSGKSSASQAKPAILTGMYKRGTHRIIKSPDGGCPLENPVGNDVVQAVLAIMRKHAIAPYDEDTGAGFMRHVVVRVGHGSGEVLVALVTNSDEFPYAKSFCRELVRRVPSITTVVQSINTRQTNVVLGDRERVLYGPGFILDRLCGLSFRISAHSFYQVNARQTEVLYNTAMQLAGGFGRVPAGASEGASGRGSAGASKSGQAPAGSKSGSEDILKGANVIDAYCGTGTIGLVAASRGASSVIGVDSTADSIRDARQNARHNGITQAEFVEADATQFMLSCAQSVRPVQPNVLFMDPPRAGSTPEFLRAAAALSPDRIVYISCNPETQVRDVRQLIDCGYRVDAVQPVDMFPHTDHVECVVSLALTAQN